VTGTHSNSLRAGRDAPWPAVVPSTDRDMGARRSDGLASVIIPCFNQGHFLEEAIASVVAQACLGEVIVVDDGSTDSTPAIASRPGVRYLRQDNQGLAEARNRGLYASQGAYVVFLDADDRLMPGALAAGVACMTANPECALVYGRYRLIDATGSPLPAEDHPAIDTEYYIELLRTNFVGHFAATMFRRVVFETVGGFSARFAGAEDYDLLLRIARAFPIGRHSRLVSEYRRHDSNMSDDHELMFRSVLELLRAQGPYVRRSSRHRAALREGRRRWALFYGQSLTKQAYLSKLSGEGIARRYSLYATLLRFYPRGILKLVAPLAYSSSFRVANRLQNVVRYFRRAWSHRSIGAIAADPNPIQAEPGHDRGATTLHWHSRGTTEVEVRLGAPHGPLFSRSAPAGSATTGKWVTDETIFFLQDASAGSCLTAAHTLATVHVTVLLSAPPTTLRSAGRAGGADANHNGRERLTEPGPRPTGRVL